MSHVAGKCGYLDPAHVKDGIVVSNPIGQPRFSYKGARFQIGANGSSHPILAQNVQNVRQAAGTLLVVNNKGAPKLT